MKAWLPLLILLLGVAAAPAAEPAPPVFEITLAHDAAREGTRPVRVEDDDDAPVLHLEAVPLVTAREVELAAPMSLGGSHTVLNIKLTVAGVAKLRAAAAPSAEEDRKLAFLAGGKLLTIGVPSPQMPAEIPIPLPDLTPDEVFALAEKINAAREK